MSSKNTKGGAVNQHARVACTCAQQCSREPERATCQVGCYVYETAVRSLIPGMSWSKNPVNTRTNTARTQQYTALFSKDSNKNPEAVHLVPSGLLHSQVLRYFEEDRYTGTTNIMCSGSKNTIHHVLYMIRPPNPCDCAPEISRGMFSLLFLAWIGLIMLDTKKAHGKCNSPRRRPRETESKSLSGLVAIRWPGGVGRYGCVACGKFKYHARGTVEGAHRCDPDTTTRTAVWHTWYDTCVM